MPHGQAGPDEIVSDEVTESKFFHIYELKGTLVRRKDEKAQKELTTRQ